MIANTNSRFITYLFQGKSTAVLVARMNEAVEHFKRKVASLKRESEELQRYKRDVDWLKTLQKKLVREAFD